jgi:zinc transport system permease protein
MLGASLVPKRYSMIGDGLSHVGFAAVAVAYALDMTPLTVAMPVCMVTAFLLLRIHESSKVKGDAAIAVVCSAALAIGVMTVSLTTGMNTDVNSYLFGSILAMSKDDVRLSVALGLVVMVVYLLFYNRFFSLTFDEEFTRATDGHAETYKTVLALLTAAIVVLGMRMMGALLISSLIVIPTLSAMRACRRFSMVVTLGAVVSVVCFMAGVTASFALSVPTGACVVLVDLAAFCLLSLISKVMRR